MADQIEQLMNHVRRPATWLRILFMVGFVVILYLLVMVLMVLTAAQALFSIFTGVDNHNLRRLGAALTEYAAQLLGYLTYNSERRPFPFAPFPDLAEASGALVAEEEQVTPEPAPAQPKKSSSRSRRKAAAPPPVTGSAAAGEEDSQGVTGTTDPGAEEIDHNRSGN